MGEVLIVPVSAAAGLGRRESVKSLLARLPRRSSSTGVTALIYHRVGGGSPDERDVTAARFEEQLDVLADHHVVPIDAAIDAMSAGDTTPMTVLTFDDGFQDLYVNGFPLLRDRELPFTLYLTTGYVGGEMHWEGSTARDTGAPAVDWDQLDVMVSSGLCTIGNHTHSHPRPEALTVDELDRCSEIVAERYGEPPRHFAYTWGVPVPALQAELARRFRTAATGRVGRIQPGADPMRLDRVPVRGSDPLDFFRAKLTGDLLPERVYAGLVGLAKRAGARG